MHIYKKKIEYAHVQLSMDIYNLICNDNRLQISPNVVRPMLDEYSIGIATEIEASIGSCSSEILSQTERESTS